MSDYDFWSQSAPYTPYLPGEKINKPNPQLGAVTKAKGYAPTTSFSGADMHVDIVFPNSRPTRIGTASTITYSTFREKRHVRTLGRISPKGFTVGPRTLAGTIIFTVINQHFINDLKETIPLFQKYDKLKIDELPPFDLVITFGNEYGQSAVMVIYGCTIVEESKTLSIEDIFTENIVTYQARDIDYMKGPYDPTLYNRRSMRLQPFDTPVLQFDIDAMNDQQDYVNYMEQKKTISATPEYAATAIEEDPYVSYTKEEMDEILKTVPNHGYAPPPIA